MNRGAKIYMRAAVAALVALLFTLAAVAPGARGESRPGPQGREEGADRHQLWLIPSPDRGVMMRTMVFRPAGSGPFPLVVLNHGSIQSAEWLKKYPQLAYPAVSEWFVRRGYVVTVPQRPGHGETGGRYLEDQGSPCERADYVRSGLAAADSIKATIDFMTRQSFVKRDGVVVVGQSAGGWGALALASRNPAHVRAIVTFAAGRGGRVNNRANNNCAPERLVDAAGAFGASARIPVLAIYVENDSYFPPSLSKRIAYAYRGAGGRLDFRLLSAFGNEGHKLFASPDGPKIWGPVVEEFLKPFH